MLNFGNFKPVNQANVRVEGASRKGIMRGQSFILKFRRAIGKSKTNGSQEIQSGFEFSTAKFKELNLADKNRGLIEVIDGDSGKSYVAIVANAHAVMLKTTGKNEKGDKGKSFKSTILEKALSEQGVLDLTDKSLGQIQKLDLVAVPDSVGVELGAGTGIVATGGVFEVVVDTKEYSKDEEGETSEPEVPVTGTPTPPETQVEAPETTSPELQVPDEVPTPTPEPASTPATSAVDDDF